MPRNIEVKARIDSVAALLPRAQALADGPAEIIDQDDTFFAVGHGRLKLREFADCSAELIHYHRADTSAAKASDYVRVAVAHATAPALREALVRACGELGRLRKRRTLLRVGPTRIHLDQVQGLADHMELEVVLHDAQSDAEGAAIAEALMRELGLADAPRVAGAYLDLLRASG